MDTNHILSLQGPLLDVNLQLTMSSAIVEFLDVLSRIYETLVSFLSFILNMCLISVKGPFVNYVSMFLPIFDQVSTLSKHIY